MPIGTDARSTKGEGDQREMVIIDTGSYHFQPIRAVGTPCFLSYSSSEGSMSCPARLQIWDGRWMSHLIVLTDVSNVWASWRPALYMK